jgi:hypothetical protein
VKNGKAIASAKQVNWLRLIVASSPDASQGFMQHSGFLCQQTGCDSWESGTFIDYFRPIPVLFGCIYGIISRLNFQNRWL